MVLEKNDILLCVASIRYLFIHVTNKFYSNLYFWSLNVGCVDDIFSFGQKKISITILVLKSFLCIFGPYLRFL